MPDIISYAIQYRARIDSFNELTKDKRPPRNLWDKPHQLEEYFDHVFDSDSGGGTKTYLEYDPNEVE
jgi:hypothetical protein